MLTLEISKNALRDTAIKGNILSHVLSINKENKALGELEYMAYGIMEKEDGTISINNFFDYPYAVPLVDINENQTFTGLKCTGALKNQYNVDFYRIKFNLPFDIPDYRKNFMKAHMENKICVLHTHPGDKEFSEKDIDEMNNDKDFSLELVLKVPGYKEFDFPEFDEAISNIVLSFIFNGHYVRTKFKELNFEEPYLSVLKEFDTTIQKATLLKIEKVNQENFVEAIAESVRELLIDENDYVDNVIKNPMDFISINFKSSDKVRKISLK